MMRECTKICKKYWYVFIGALVLCLPAIPISLIFMWLLGTKLNSSVLGFILSLIIFDIIVTSPLIVISKKIAIKYGEKGLNRANIKVFIVTQGIFMLFFLLIGAIILFLAMTPS